MSPKDISRFDFTKVSWFEIHEKGPETRETRETRDEVVQNLLPLMWSQKFFNPLVIKCFNLFNIKQNLLMQINPVSLVLKVGNILRLTQ